MKNVLKIFTALAVALSFSSYALNPMYSGMGLGEQFGNGMGASNMLGVSCQCARLTAMGGKQAAQQNCSPMEIQNMDNFARNQVNPLGATLQQLPGAHLNGTAPASVGNGNPVAPLVPGAAQ